MWLLLVWKLALLMSDGTRDNGRAICLGFLGLLPMPIPESSEGPSSYEGDGLDGDILMMVNCETMITIAGVSVAMWECWRELEELPYEGFKADR
jgi:hypothetical protein